MLEVNLKKLRFAYPPDDGLPTPEQLAVIDKIVPQDIEVITVSSLFDEHTVNKEDATGKVDD